MRPRLPAAGTAPWHRDDAGSAIIEFVFVAVLVMVPLIYLIVTVATVQRSQLAVTNAAREAGRAFATSMTPDQGLDRAAVAARLAFTDAGLTDPASIRFVDPTADCSAAPTAPTLQPGAVFTVCVVRATRIPGVPGFLQGRGITSEGRYVVHVDDYRSGAVGATRAR